MANGEGTSTDPRLRDPLSDVTRKERAYLLGLSAAGIVIVFTGLVPERITALGIQFAETDQRTLLRLLAAVIAYFLIAFVIYAASDYVSWHRHLREKLVHYEMEYLRSKRTYLQAKLAAPSDTPREPLLPSKRAIQEQLEDLEKHEHEHQMWLIRGHKFSGSLSTLRLGFEYGLPILVAIYSIYLLVF